jgi:hypothetical protein
VIYVLQKRDNTFYGHDAFLDIARLSKLMNYTDGAILDVGANSGQTTQQLLREFPRKKFTLSSHIRARSLSFKKMYENTAM